MNESISYRFFLGANSSQGFVSFFPNATSDPAIAHNYVFKGGPGCGKSTAMRRVVDEAAQRGLRREIIYCSSDPGSLDGALFPTIGAAVYDGTAPHTIELAFPGAEGSYVTPPPFQDAKALQGKTAGLRQANGQLGRHYQQVFRLTAAAGKVRENIRARLEPIGDLARLTKRAQGIIGRELPHAVGPGREKKRFLSGITPEGLLCFYDSVEALAKKVYDLQDPYGFASALLEPICKAALERGHEVYACYSPLHPDRLEHLILPGLELAFVTSNSYHTYPGGIYRRINIAGILDRAALREVRGEVRLLQKIERSLLEDAVEELHNTKGIHDRLESYYRPHLDFDAMDRKTEELLQTINAREEYGLEHFVCLTTTNESFLLNGAEQLSEPTQTHYCGFLLEDGERLSLLNMRTATQYEFTKE